MSLDAVMIRAAVPRFTVGISIGMRKNPCSSVSPNPRVRGPPKVEIIFRGDSGFCRWRILRWCERHDVRYIVGLAKNGRGKAQVAPWIDRADSLHKQTGKKQRLFASIHYGALS